jgi:hypothetical protein
MDIIDKPISTENMISLFINNIKQILNNIKNDEHVKFSDFKAGGLHWTLDEVLNELKGNLTLRDACKIIDVIKLDIFVPYNSRYIEMSSFYILKSSTGFINVDKDYFNNFEESLFNDIQTYKDTKPFKAVKRLWSISRIRNDLETMGKLESLINSNVSLFSQINADLETLELMLQKNINYDKDFVIEEIDGFKDKINHILDIEYDDKLLYNSIDNLVLSFKNDRPSEEIINKLSSLHDSILAIINKETINYLKSINFSLPDKFVKSVIKPNTLFNHDTILNISAKSIEELKDTLKIEVLKELKEELKKELSENNCKI